MVRYLIDQDASTLEDVLGFNTAGYAYSASETQDEMSPVFIR